MLSWAQVVGQDDRHIVTQDLPEGIDRPVHRELVPPFLLLQEEARRAGFDLRIASGFRDYQRQLAIWNGKAKGLRPLLDDQGRILEAGALDEESRALAILRWSALPGLSRHHWGCDIDVYDAAAVPPGYEVRLVPEEVRAGGVFAALHEWLDGFCIERPEMGFFRPYAEDRGGIAPERWHLSYAPLALTYQNRLSLSRVRTDLLGPELALATVVSQHLLEWFERFVWVPRSAYPEVFQSQVREVVGG